MLENNRSTQHETSHQPDDTFAHEQLEKIRKQHEVESVVERRDNSRNEDAREAAHEALHEAESKTHTPAETQQTNIESKRIVPKAERAKAFAAKMSEIRQHMNPTSRAFSTVIHHPIVERVSETTGKTIARPNAILAGSISACILVLAVYLIAKEYGYVLSGAETMVAFGLGWVLGIIYDFVKAMVTGGQIRS